MYKQKMISTQAKTIGTFMRTFRRFVAHKWSSIGLHPGQGAILRELRDPSGVSQSDLAKAVGVTQPTMAKGLSRMEKSGIIVRKPDPVDGRVSHNFLTKKGRNLVEAYNASWEEIETHLFAGMTDQEISAGLAFIQRLERNLTTKE